MVTGLVASIFPDIDLFYSYFITSHRVKHHDYWTHIPLFWVAVAAISTLFIKISGKRGLSIYLWVGFSNVMLHMMMDSIAAEIKWLYPFSNWELNLVKIPAIHHWWVLNFVLHWTFGLEILIIVIAAFVWIKDQRQPA